MPYPAQGAREDHNPQREVWRLSDRDGARIAVLKEPEQEPVYHCKSDPLGHVHASFFTTLITEQCDGRGADGDRRTCIQKLVTGDCANRRRDRCATETAGAAVPDYAPALSVRASRRWKSARRYGYSGASRFRYSVPVGSVLKMGSRSRSPTAQAMVRHREGRLVRWNPFLRP
jgi:hypothetical protein